MVPKLLCAPLADITTGVLRHLIRTTSKSTLVHSEMISAAALLHGGIFNDSKTAIYDSDPPFAFQLIGNNAHQMAQATQLLNRYNPFAIDINMGCSAPDLRKKGLGSYLLKDFTNTADIVEEVRKKCTCRLSVKMRTGILESSASFVIRYLELFESCGVDYVTLHPRNAHEGFKHKANRNLFSEIKAVCKIPLVFNGDITDTNDAVKLLDGFSDSIMIGREAVRRPWIFGMIEAELNGEKKDVTIDLREFTKLFTRKSYKLLPNEILRLRCVRFYSYFCNNFHFGHTLFTAIKKEKSPLAMEACMLEYLKRHPEEIYINF
ncbi:MAG: tRNA-dihydrouridine synthase family protein [Spirochaetes bacterium]|jgi:tRNA-dihydrouridine synthase B|nr:tRNA-dihydrouridine synthase family protein [Spirochaetota bacterium]